jgi:hypothetical protein
MSNTQAGEALTVTAAGRQSIHLLRMLLEDRRCKISIDKSNNTTDDDRKSSAAENDDDVVRAPC